MMIETIRTPSGAAQPNRGFSIKRFLPRGLFGRSLLIILAPMVLLQGIVSYVFFERHIDTSMRRMARDIAADTAFLTAIEDTYPSPERERLRALAARMLHFDVTFLPGQHIPAPEHQAKHLATFDRALDEIVAQQFGGDRQFRTESSGDNVEVSVEAHDGVLHVIVPRDRVTVSAPDLFILWMVGSSLVLLAVAVLFLKNQVRPIERLARAADAFGRGRDVPDFKPYGATEVRRAAQAFITMRQRIERYVQQRTEMLAGVSHDLKTPLTRIKLQLELMGHNPESAALRDDVGEMEHMLDEYLDFARGEGGETAQACDLAEIVRQAAEAAAQARGSPERLTVDAPGTVMASVKPHALRRCIVNLIDNALKHGRHVAVSLVCDERGADILVDDDGPGIAEARREEAFRPFHRLDEGRNLQMGGLGLGLAIARDIARAHGGDLTLHVSPLGGLRADIRIPA